MYYLYAGHLGGVYWSERDIPYDERYCETCGDVDQCIGAFDTPGEMRRLLEDCYIPYDKDYINEVVKEFKLEVQHW